MSHNDLIHMNQALRNLKSKNHHQCGLDSKIYTLNTSFKTYQRSDKIYIYIYEILNKHVVNARKPFPDRLNRWNVGLETGIRFV